MFEVGDVGGLGCSMFDRHHVDDAHTGYKQHAVDWISQEEGICRSDRGEEGVEQRGEAAQACVVDRGGTFVDTDHGVSGVGGMVGWHCDVRSGGDVVGQCGVGVGGAVELVEVPLGVCEQRCE